MNTASIVTGASGGIGRAVAERLAKDGFAVAVHYSGNAAKAEEAAQRIRSEGGRAVALGADVSKPDDVRSLFQDAERALGSLTVVVNAAGIMPLAPIEDGDVDAFDRVIATNLRGTYLVLSEAARRLPNDGRIVAFSSSVVAKAFPGYGAYVASKAGVEGLVHVLANELGARGITVNAVAPGPVATDLFLKGKSEAQIAVLAKAAPLGRLGDPLDVARVVSFLVGAEGGWVNGQVVRVNGGFV